MHWITAETSDPKNGKSVDIQGTILYRHHQVPLVLGDGLIVHRAQGLTLDAVMFQMDGLFAPWQSYTALSRVQDFSRLEVQGTPTLGMKCADQRMLDFECDVKCTQ